MHRGHQKISRPAATVAGEYAPGAIGSVRRGREAEYQYARVRIAEAWNRFRPVRVVTERRALDSRDLTAIRAQPLALRARNDVVVNLREGHFSTSYQYVGSGFSRTVTGFSR